MKIVKECKPSLFYTAHNALLTPLPLQFYFPPQVFRFPFSTILLFSLFDVFYSPPPPPPPHLFYIFSIHKYIDLLTTLHPSHLDPSSTLHRPLIDPTSTLRRPYTSTHIDPTLNFFNTASWIVKLYTTTTTTTTTFLLFSLHHHHHHRHISIVFRPAPTPPPQHCF